MPRVISRCSVTDKRKCETTRQNSRLITHSLQNGHHSLQALGDGQLSGNVLHHALVQAFEQRHTLGEALAEVDFATHCALGDGTHLLANACTIGQLVDHLGLNQRRIHIEADQTARTAIDVVALERHIDTKFVRHLHQLRLHRVTILDRTAHRELDTRFWGASVGFEGHTTRQATNCVDIQFLLSNYFGCLGNLSCGNFTTEQSDDISVFALRQNGVINRS